MTSQIAECQAKGTDSQFRAFIQRQPSCLTRRFSEYLESGEGRNPACHVRRAATSGTGFKAPYACVPMTQGEHLIQHQQGEAALLDRYLPKAEGWTPEAAKEWFDRKVVEYRRMWVNRN